MKFFQSLHITRLFFVLFACVVGMFILAFVFDWFMFVGIISLVCLFSFLFIDVFLSFSVKNPISIERKLQKILNLGDENKVEIAIENTTNQPLNIIFYEGYPVEMQKRESAAYLFIPAGEIKTFTYDFVPKTRGDFHFGNLMVFISSFLFLCKRKIDYPLKNTIQVYPSILQMKQFELKVFHKQTLAQGIKKIRRIGHNNEFEQIKNYVEGDDIRTVNWKATSKRSNPYEVGLMVNQYQEERSQSIYAVIDKSRNMQSQFENMSMLDFSINSALVFANIALKKGDKAGLITFSDKIGTQLHADRNASQLRRILNLLYNQKTHFKESSFELLYESIRQTIKTRSLLMLYTNFESEFAMRRALPTLKRINQKHVLVLVFFQNNELEELAFQKVETSEQIYQSAVAEKLINLKVNIARELKQNGIQTLLTRPEDLNVTTINKYLELKAKGVI